MAMTCGQCGGYVSVEMLARAARPVCDACREVPRPTLPPLPREVRELRTTSESGRERDLRLGFRRGGR